MPSRRSESQSDQEALIVRVERITMATYTPPPYFPQASLAPPDKNRYRRFKLIVSLVIIAVALVLAGIAYGIWKVITWL